MNSNEVTIAETTVREDVRFKEAHQAVKKELAALPAEKVVQVNLDIHCATAKVIAGKAKREALRQALHEQLRKYDSRGIDKIEVYAHALLHADSVLQQKRKSLTHDPLRWAIEEANDRKHVLVADCRSLVERKLLSATALDDYSGQNGYKNIVSDLELLCTVLSTHWEHIEGRCATTRRELERARRVALRMVRLLAKREEAYASVAKAADNRARAFTLFINCYDEIRRGVTFVRWHEGDLEEIAPSLYAHPGRHNGPHPNPLPRPPVAGEGAGIAVRPHAPLAGEGAGIAVRPHAPLAGEGAGIAILPLPRERERAGVRDRHERGRKVSNESGFMAFS